MKNVDRLKSFFAIFICNKITLIGTIITTLLALVNVAYLIAEMLHLFHNPLINFIFTLGIGPMFMGGLAIVFGGIIFELIKQRKKDPNLFKKHYQYFFRQVFGIKYISSFAIAMVVFLIPALLLIVVILGASYHFMESPSFCGEVCHKMMTPELVTYKRSPHSNVACTHCHIGPGIVWFVKAKLNGMLELITYVRGTYPRPIHTPLHGMRPAHGTCVHCHNPNKYHGRRFKVFEHFLPDRENTKIYNVILLNIGGPEPYGKKHPSIHWHINEGNEVSFKSEHGKREIITWVGLKQEGEEPAEYHFTGVAQTYEELLKASEQYGPGKNKNSNNIQNEKEDTHTDAEKNHDKVKEEKVHGEEKNAHAEKENNHGKQKKKHGKKDHGGGHGGGNGDEERIMDCFDCHNRPTHMFQSAEEAIEYILIREPDFQKIPFIKKAGMEIILKKYSEEEILDKKIQKELLTWYHKNREETGRVDKALLRKVSEEIQSAYRINNWPELNLLWSTYPDHRGHTQSNGCIRCHDNNHRTKEGKPINADCNLCHEILSLQEKEPEILKGINWAPEDTAQISLQKERTKIKKKIKRARKGKAHIPLQKKKPEIKRGITGTRKDTEHTSLLKEKSKIKKEINWTHEDTVRDTSEKEPSDVFIGK